MKIDISLKDNTPLLWWEPKNYPTKNILEYDRNIQPTDQYVFMQSLILPELKHEIVVKSEVNEKSLKDYDILFSDIPAPIVSTKLLEILNEFCPGDFQSFPVKIINSKNNGLFINLDYYILNITSSIESIDEEKSYIKFFENSSRISQINKLFFKINCMNEHHLSREKSFKGLILISRLLANELNKRSVKGGYFPDPNEVYNDPFPDEYLLEVYPRNPEAAKRFFVTQMNSSEDYEFFKTRVCKVPKEIMESIIEMTLARSTFHAKECSELKEIMKNCE